MTAKRPSLRVALFGWMEIVIGLLGSVLLLLNMLDLEWSDHPSDWGEIIQLDLLPWVAFPLCVWLGRGMLCLDPRARRLNLLVINGEVLLLLANVIGYYGAGIANDADLRFSLGAAVATSLLVSLFLVSGHVRRQFETAASCTR